CAFRDLRRPRQIVHEVGDPAGVDHAEGGAGAVVRQARQVGLRADGREGAPVDLGAVPDVVDQHCSFQGAASFSTTGPQSVPQRRSHPAQWTGISGARSRPATQRPASPWTSPRDFAQPGLPVQAVTPTQGEAASTAKPASASVAATASAPPGSRSRSTTLRRGVIRTSPPAPAASASTVAWAPDSLPSGGTASSATLPSRCSTNPA